MGKISKKVMDKDIEERMFEVFWRSLTGIKRPSQMKKFLDSFISDVEHIMLAKRLGIALMLAKGYPYREIRDALKVSTATIMSVSIRYKVGGKGLDPAIKKILRDEKIEDFLDNIEEFLLMLEGPKLYGSPKYESRVKTGKRLYKRRKRRGPL